MGLLLLLVLLLLLLLLLLLRLRGKLLCWSQHAGGISWECCEGEVEEYLLLFCL